jgi:hypothetical protein
MVGAGATVEHDRGRSLADAALEDADTAHIPKANAGQLAGSGDWRALELRKSLPQMNTDNNDGSLHDQMCSLRDS